MSVTDPPMTDKTTSTALKERLARLAPEMLPWVAFLASCCGRGARAISSEPCRTTATRWRPLSSATWFSDALARAESAHLPVQLLPRRLAGG